MIQRYISALLVFIFIGANVSFGQLTNTYCTSASLGGANDVSDIGGFSFGSFVTTTGGQHLANPTAVKTYTDNTAKDIIAYVDSNYHLEVYHTQNNSLQEDAKVTLFLDFNNNGVYEASELAWITYTNSSFVYQDTTLRFPLGSVVLSTWIGMRVVLNNFLAPSTASDLGCGSYTSGETEDYKIKFLQRFKLDIPGATAPEAIIKVYPNPSAGVYNVAIGNNNGPVDITVLNLLGQTVYSQAGITMKGPISVSITDAPAGIYQLIIKMGGQVATQKLVKQ